MILPWISHLKRGIPVLPWPLSGLVDWRGGRLGGGLHRPACIGYNCHRRQRVSINKVSFPAAGRALIPTPEIPPIAPRADADTNRWWLHDPQAARAARLQPVSTRTQKAAIFWLPQRTQANYPAICPCSGISKYILANLVDIESSFRYDLVQLLALPALVLCHA
jgi:hypothetical protein